MNRNEYQNAFSKLEPSPEAVRAALSPRQTHQTRKGVRLGNLLLAAVLVVALLVGTVFAAVHFNWFSVGGAQSLTQPVHDSEAAGKDESLPPEPQNLLTLEGAPSETYIGFTLPESYLDGQDSRNSWMLENGLYRRYYRNPDPSDPDSPLLTAQIVYDANWLTRYPSETVKEEELNGMQTVWLRLESSESGKPQYCLFQRNDDLGCFAVIASTTSFEEAEQAAREMRYADSGIPIAGTEEQLSYGFRLGWEPENMTPDSRTVMADRWYLANAVLRDDSLDLNEILLVKNWVAEGETLCNIGVWIEDDLRDIAPIENGTVYKTGAMNGRTVRWVQGYGGGTYIQVLFPEEQVQLIARISCSQRDPVTGVIEEVAAEEPFIGTAEQLLESAELISVAVAEPAPQDFAPFSVG